MSCTRRSPKRPTWTESAWRCDGLGLTIEDPVKDSTFTNDHGQPDHVCAYMPILLPGGRRKFGGARIGQATLHMREVLYDEAPVQTASHTGAQIPIPRADLHVLQRSQGRVDGWYRAKLYGCRASDPDACDEWPWQATSQGGPGLSHLRIINGKQNSASGNELKNFYEYCKLSKDEYFLVAPVPRFLLLEDWGLGLPTEPISSEFSCRPKPE